MLRCVALVRTDVSGEPSASFKVTGIGELGAVLPSSPILVTLMKETLSSSETSVLTRATRRNIPGDGILHSHRRENLKSYLNVLLVFCYSLSLSLSPLTTPVVYPISANMALIVHCYLQQ
jgi:hypothetical protein